VPPLQGAPALRAVKNILTALTIPQDTPALPVTAFGEVGIGRRLAASSKLVASILFQSNDSRIPTLGQYQFDFTIAVEMFYRVDQSTETAEIMLADAYPAALDAFYNNKTLVDPATNLATVRSSIVTGPASNPWYEALASAEYRLQVLFLNCWSRNTFNAGQP
jgi:hypothetical protein